MAAGGVFAIRLVSIAPGHFKDMEPDIVHASGNKASVGPWFTNYKGFSSRSVVGFRPNGLANYSSVAPDRLRKRYEHLRKRRVGVEIGRCVAI
jgi:hypothetical protein